MSYNGIRNLIARYALRITIVATCLVPNYGASAAPVTYFGLDVGAGEGDPRPITAAKEALFLADAGPGTNLITFEQLSSGPGIGHSNVPNIPGSMAIAPTVDLASSPAETGGTSIGSPGSRSGFSTGGDRSWLGASVGYNTTPGGQVFLFMDTPGDATTGIFGGYWLYTFSTPISAFGATITGWRATGFDYLFFEFNDGSERSLTFSGDANDSTLFFGFVDEGASITSVKVRQNGPSVWSMDDVYYTNAVPEPSSIVLGSIGLLGWIASRLRRH